MRIKLTDKFISGYSGIIQAQELHGQWWSSDTGNPLEFHNINGTKILLENSSDYIIESESNLNSLCRIISGALQGDIDQVLRYSKTLTQNHKDLEILIREIFNPNHNIVVNE